MVVGRDAAQTPSLLSVLSSILEATTKGGAHYRKKNKLRALSLKLITRSIAAPL